jgi:hypothetical protein
MNCEVDFLNTPIFEALGQFNQLLVNAALVEDGNAEKVTVYIHDYEACFTTLYKMPNGDSGGCSILDFIKVNNILAACGRSIEFKRQP